MGGQIFKVPVTVPHAIKTEIAARLKAVCPEAAGMTPDRCAVLWLQQCLALVVRHATRRVQEGRTPFFMLEDGGDSDIERQLGGKSRN